MKTPKILMNFNNLTDSELEIKSLSVYTAMYGNVSFANPSPGMEVLDAAIKNFNETLVGAQSRDKVKVILKNQSRVELQAILVQLASFATYTARGDRALLTSTNFTLNAVSNTPKLLGTPENFSVQVGKSSGQALMNINSMKGAKTYIYCYAQTPVINDSWLHAASTSSSMVVSYLESGKEYSFKVGITGSKGQTVYSEIIKKLVV